MKSIKKIVVQKYDYHTKIKDMEDKIPDTTNLATTVKKADYDAEIKILKINISPDIIIINIIIFM